MGIILTSSKRTDGDKSNKDYDMLRNYTAVALHDFSCSKLSKLLFDLQVFLVFCFYSEFWCCCLDFNVTMRFHPSRMKLFLTKYRKAVFCSPDHDPFV